MPESLELFSPAKINLWLRIHGKREDGFHEVETRLAQLSLGDTVQLEHRGKGSEMELTCSEPGIPVDASNLAVKALLRLNARLGEEHSWKVHLEKRTPSGAGLGGGSSNAAAVLAGANRLLGEPLPLETLLEIGGEIGSDVPCFLLPTPVADGLGRGEKVVPVASDWELPLVLIKPPFPIPTPWAYKSWLNSQELDGIRYEAQVLPWGEMVNHLERPVFEKYLLLGTIKMWLLEQTGVQAALMSGSGSTMFAVTETLAQAEALAAQARERFGDTMWVQTAKTLAGPR